MTTAADPSRPDIHEAEQFLRYLLACSTHPTPFDLKAHVPRIKRILGEYPDEDRGLRSRDGR
jgi:hypothetical protein